MIMYIYGKITYQIIFINIFVLLPFKPISFWVNPLQSYLWIKNLNRKDGRGKCNPGEYIHGQATMMIYTSNMKHKRGSDNLIYYHLFPSCQINFISKFKFYFILSAVLCFLCIYLLIF